MSNDDTTVGNNGAQLAYDHEWNYYTLYRIPVIINDRNGKSTIREREIGRVFAEYKDNLVVIDGENKKEHEYLIPKSKIDRIDDKQIYLNISDVSLREFEF